MPRGGKPKKGLKVESLQLWRGLKALRKLPRRRGDWKYAAASCPFEKWRPRLPSAGCPH